MESIMEIIGRGVDQLQDRLGGPLYFRLFFMPVVVSLIALRAGLRDAREGRVPFLWALISTPGERKELYRSAIRDVGRVFITALVLDTVYQFMVLQGFYVIQAVIIAVACAVVPYLLVRGPVTRIVSLLSRK